MTDGSSLESDIDALLEGRLLLLLNGFSALRLSSSSLTLLRCLRQKNMAPAMAPTTATPTTTPAAMAAIFGPLDALAVLIGEAASDCPGAVTTTVLARVITDGAASWVVSGEDAALGLGEDAALGLAVADEESEGVASGSGVGDNVAAADGFILETALSSPVSWTDQKPCPPPVARLAYPFSLPRTPVYVQFILS